GSWTIRAWPVQTLLVHLSHLTPVDVTRDVARYAAQLRAHYRIRPADALQVAIVPWFTARQPL
ncbi:MAG: hypothetical protein DRP09_20055, partial [Candidatus Thorarchaeota archaeon]